MKKAISLVLLLIILQVSMITVYAKKEKQANYPIADFDIMIPLTKAKAELLSKISIFNELERDVARQEFTWELVNYMPEDENYVFSPISIKIALAMTANGGDGETKEEILKALGIDDLDSFNEYTERLMRDYSEKEAVELSIANSVWLNSDYDRSVDFKDSFRNTVKDYYQADVTKVNSYNAVNEINSWVDNKTKGKITELISDSDFLACLVNATYFKGEWAVEFNESDTKKAEFTDRNGKKTELDFINTQGRLNYYEDSSVQIVRLPYKDKGISMYIAIPANPADRQLNLEENIEKMERIKVDVSLPKFKTEFSTSLVDALLQMGIISGFDPAKADFNNMFTNSNAYISSVIHKAYINVDESGTEAAAVTGIIMENSAIVADECVKYNANRPFIYFIRDDKNGEILFIGEYAYGN